MKLDPLTVRDRMIRGYTRSYQRAQIEMTPQQIEAQVIADCQLVDAARAAGDLNGAPKPRDPAEPVKHRPDLVQQAAQEQGVSTDPRGKAIRSRRVHGNPVAISERWGCAAGRIKRILECVNRKTSSLVVAVESAEGNLAVLAAEFAELWSNFLLREQPPPLTGNDRNPFRGMTTRDAARKFQRLVEDICDRSTGVLGHWYVK